jgi:membrane protease YdiL (CAAX protease family)
MGSDPVELRSLAIATAGVVAVEGLARWAIANRGIDPLTGIGLARLFDIAGMALVIAWAPQGWSRIGLGRQRWARGLMKGLFWSAGFGILAAIGYGLLQMAGLDPLRIIRPGPLGLRPNPPLLFLVGGLIAPIAEEFYFRGLMYGYCRRFGFWPALLLSTAVFTFLHGSAAGTYFPQIVGGLVFATAYEIEKSLLVPILIHVLGNAAIFSLAYL